MRIAVLVLTVLVSVSLVGSALAVPSGKTVEYADGSQGKVIFDGKIHAEKAGKCSECHPKIFPMKKGIKMTMAEINEGKYCGACHDGAKAFKASDQANCGKCHKK